MAGKSLLCPHCHAGLPPVAEPAPPYAFFLSPRYPWIVCWTVTALVAIHFLIRWSMEDSAVRQAAHAGFACVWILAAYVITRCREALGAPRPQAQPQNPGWKIGAKGNES
jgi:hypothetical protein